MPVWAAVGISHVNGFMIDMSQSGGSSEEQHKHYCEIFYRMLNFMNMINNKYSYST